MHCSVAVSNPLHGTEDGNGTTTSDVTFVASPRNAGKVDVGAAVAVARTYLVSGSRFNNLQPGSYRVQSKSRTANAFDGSGTMEYFVRFATGFSEPIGFHSVPKDNAGVLE